MNYYFESQSNQSLKQDNHYYFSLFLSLSLFPLSPSLSLSLLRFHQSDVLSYLLTPAPVEARKRLPSQANPDLASEIRDLVSRALVSQGSEEGGGGAGDWSCHYMDQLTTFLLPQGEWAVYDFVFL